MDELIETTEIIEPEQEQEPDKKPKKKENSLWSWVKCILFAVVLAWVITHVVIVNAEVPTGSMIDTIMPKDRIVAFRLAYLVAGPQRGDIVVFKYPDDESQLFIKRVIGLPGDTIEGKNGLVYINDEPLDEDYTDGQKVVPFGPYEVPENSYFMMGDNRNGSWDSRYWENKFVSKDKILGKALFRYYPSISALH